MPPDSRLPHRLPDILARVVRPARYTGNEWNSIVKEWDGRLHVALVFPDVYEESVCDHWTLSLYASLNQDDSLLCERVYVPWPDMDQALRQAGLSLFSLESQRPLAAFDAIVAVLPGELYYPALLTILDLAGLPLRREARDKDHPIVIGAGPCTANPEPVAAFCDAFVIGDVDADILRGAVDALRYGGPTPAGLYVPSAYAIEYKQDGTIARIEPATRVVAHRALPSPPLTRPIVPYVEARRERGIVELARPPLYPWTGQPQREYPVEQILATVEATLGATGYDRIHLSEGHSCLEAIVSGLSSRYAGTHTQLTLADQALSMRAVELADRLPSSGKGSITFNLVPDIDSRGLASLAGGETHLVAAARLAFRRGYHVLRLRAAAGFAGDGPGELERLGSLARRVRDAGYEEIDGRAQVHVLAYPFIPRAHSALERAGIAPSPTWKQHVEILSRGVRGPGLRLHWHGLETRLVEAALARGDRRLAAVIETAWRAGMRRRQDSDNAAAWQAAFDCCAVDVDFYATRERQTHEILPWQHIALEP